MDKEKLFAQIKGGLIVSCQALETEPLYTKEGGVMPLMAKAAAMSGAVGIRANTVRDITQIKQVVDLPVIGIIKKDYPGTPMYITVTMKEVDELVACGVDILAVQGTGALRPDGSTSAEFIRAIKAKYPDQLLMADCDNFENAMLCAEAGADFVGTTMRGYTPETQGINDIDFEFVHKLATECPAKIIAEGHIHYPEQAVKALEAGAFCVVLNHPVEGVPAEKAVLCADSYHAMMVMGANYRSQFHLRVVGVTGSVGKTTTTINLAASLATLEKKVLVVDADPQANASSGLGVDIKQAECTIYECIIDRADVREAIHDTEIDTLKVISSHINLVGAEIEMLNLKNRERILKEVLSPLKSEFDYILIDCSPSLGLITVNALTAADSVIIPVQAEYFALEGISKLLNTIKIIKSKLNPALEIEGFLLTMYDSRLRQANQIYDEVKRHFQELVFKTVIQRNVKLSEAPSYGLPTILYDADSTGAKNHMALAKELIEREK